jgi:RNA polymerase sigma factor (sigma-70 family)
METAVVVDRAQSELGMLLAGISARDRQSFTKLVALFDSDLLRLAFMVSGDSELAEDAVQTTWERLWHKPPSMRHPELIGSWLRSVAANEARRAGRRRKRGRILEHRQALDTDIRELSARADEIDLRAAMQRLPATDRELLALRYLLDLSSPEIAAQLKLSPEGVRTRLRRALSRLRKELTS